MMSVLRPPMAMTVPTTRFDALEPDSYSVYWPQDATDTLHAKGITIVSGTESSYGRLWRRDYGLPATVVSHTGDKTETANFEYDLILQREDKKYYVTMREFWNATDREPAITVTVHGYTAQDKPYQTPPHDLPAVDHNEEFRLREDVYHAVVGNA